MSSYRRSGEWSSAVRQQSAIAKVARLGLQNAPLDEIFGEVVSMVATILGVPLSALLARNDAAGDFTVDSAWTQDQVVPRRFLEGVRVPGGTGSLPGYAVIAGELVRSDALGEDPRFEAQAGAYGSPSGAALVAPVGWGSRTWGVLGAWTTTRRQWSEDDAEFLQSLANTLGLAMFRRATEVDRLESSTRLELALDASELGIFDWSSDDRRIVLDDRGAHLAGLADGFTELADTTLFEIVVPADRQLLRQAIAEAMQTTAHIRTRFRFRNRALGEIRWGEIWARIIETPSGAGRRGDEEAEPVVRIVGVVGDVTEQYEAEVRMETLFEAEQAARHSAERARERATLLAQVSEVFSRTLASDAVIDSITDLVVPTIADGGFAVLRREGGGFGHATDKFVDEDLQDTFRALNKRRTSGEPSTAPILDLERIWQTGEGELRSELADHDHRAAASGEEHLAEYRRIGLTSAVGLPLRVRGRIIGVAVFVQTARSGRHFDSDDLLFLQQLADRATLAWDNARLYEARNRALSSLQNALLPPALPVNDALELTARYAVATGTDLDVGGDFYDVIEMGDGGLGLVIGDVCGRGSDAAAISGLVRHSIRAAIVRNSLPSGILAHTNDAVLGQIDDASFCTAAFIRAEPRAGGRVRIVACSAGHPPPLVLRADGTADHLDCSGVLLGVVPHPDLRDAEIFLEPGDAIVLYTDGFTEARDGDEFFGEQRMLRAAAELAGYETDEIADGLIAAIDAFTDRSTDDRALLVARVPGRGSVG